MRHTASKEHPIEAFLRAYSEMNNKPINMRIEVVDLQFRYRKKISASNF